MAGKEHWDKGKKFSSPAYHLKPEFGISCAKLIINQILFYNVAS